MTAQRIFKVDEDIFSINVFEGKNGGWLFVSVNNKTIFEQPGFETDDDALDFGEKYVQSYIFHKF